ncbi:TUL4 family lipoprotein, partial [Francisella tularensis subsp. holarctica]|uniref:TUL4 family lipoprotein n=1 Tax=Francisella tularensis TaxID=263 RepID=UPI0023819A8D
TAAATTANTEHGAAVSKPSENVCLNKLGQDKLKATVYTAYNNNPQGSVSLQWQAPVGCMCHDTSFAFTKYAEKIGRTWGT